MTYPGPRGAMSLREHAHQDDADRQAELTERSAFESLVTQATELVVSHELEPFVAVDRVTTTYGYADFEAVLTAVRAEVEC